MNEGKIIAIFAIIFGIKIIFLIFLYFFFLNQSVIGTCTLYADGRMSKKAFYETVCSLIRRYIRARK